MTIERSAIVVVNARSRHSRRLLDRALRRLDRRGIRVAVARAVEDPSKLVAELLAALAQDQSRLVIVGGGDGTVSEVVDHVRDRVLGLLPFGTSNNFARTLGIPLDVDAAVDVIADGRVAAVDLGRVDGDYFANVASFGLTARVAASVPDWSKRHLGRLGYALAGLRAIASQRPFDVTLTIDGAEHRLTAHQVVVANGRYHAGRPIVDDATADDRRLVVHVLATERRPALARELLAYLARRDDWRRDTAVFGAAEVTVEAVPTQRLEIDGELKARTPVRIAVAPAALRVVVPA